jgi:hypothetical protein
MARLPWTKFQDFYLRLGFLKALVASLSDQRRSALNDSIVRRLERPLFDGAPAHPSLWREVERLATWYPRKTPGGKEVTHPEVAEAILIRDRHESVLYGITRDTAYKILDWGRDVEFVGRGNQITERGLLLRHLFDVQAAEKFFSGDVLAWDPFHLEAQEKLFFLYHLFEIDRLTVEVLDDLGNLDADSTLESAGAARITCKALFRVLDEAQSGLQPRDIPAFRTAKALAATIAGELELSELVLASDGDSRPRVPRPVRPSARRSAFSGAGSASRGRRTTKNADHQTIPRFEQLVDLGFLRKPPEGDIDDDASRLAASRRWRYRPTEACKRWAEARRAHTSEGQPFLWSGFARAAVASLGRSTVPHVRRTAVENLAHYLWSAYQLVARPMGHTPFDSIALIAMLQAAADGIAIEMAEFHDLVLGIKQASALPEHAFFASGNDLDRMFIQLKSGFEERVLALPKLPGHTHHGLQGNGHTEDR